MNETENGTLLQTTGSAQKNGRSAVITLHPGSVGNNSTI